MPNSVQEEYIHPVIAAMQNAYSTIERTKALKFDQDLQNREEELRNAQFTELQKEHQRQEQHANEQHDINLEHLNLARRQSQLENTKAVQDLINSGVKPIQAPDINIPGQTNDLPGYQGPSVQLPQLGKSVIPGSDFQFDPKGFSTPEEQFNRQLGQQTAAITATTKAQQDALEPYKIKEDERTKANRLAEIALQGDNANKVATTNHAQQLELEKMRGQFQLQAALIAHRQGNVDNAPLFQNALDGVLTGQTSYSALPKDIKEGVSSLAGAKGWQLPTNQKDYSKKIDTVSGVQELINQARELALHYSSDSPDTGVVKKAAAFATGGGAVPGTDLYSKLQTFKANGGALASFFDQQNRKSDAEILRQTAGLFDPRATIAQNLQKLQDQQGPLNNATKGLFAGMKPEQINYILGTRGINDLGGFETDKPVEQPPWLKIAPKKSASGKDLNVPASIRLGHPAYGEE